jgi:hypothetical protein
VVSAIGYIQVALIVFGKVLGEGEKSGFYRPVHRAAIVAGKGRHRQWLRGSGKGDAEDEERGNTRESAHAHAVAFSRLAF